MISAEKFSFGICTVPDASNTDSFGYQKTTEYNIRLVVIGGSVRDVLRVSGEEVCPESSVCFDEAVIDRWRDLVLNRSWALRLPFEEPLAFASNQRVGVNKNDERREWVNTGVLFSSASRMDSFC